MTLQDLYELAIEMGIKADPRGTADVKKYLDKVKKAHKDAPKSKQKFLDAETLKNPYSDTRILHGDPKKQIKKVLAGIDADAPEVLMYDRLNEKGGKYDALISHHPSGHALASLHEVMDIQIDMFGDAGVPLNVAHALFDERKEMVRRRVSPINHAEAVDAARLLDVPLLAIHTVWDNLGHKFMREYVGKKKYDTVDELVDYLNELPEYAEATRGKAGPSIFAGSPNRRVGKVFVGFTGGTEPSKELYRELVRAGVGTLVEMHMAEEALAEVRKLHVNVIVAGHMASDSIGANLYLDELERRGVEAVACSGLIRVRRNSKP